MKENKAKFINKNHLEVLDYMAKNSYGEFGFSTCTEKEQDNLLESYMRKPETWNKIYNANLRLGGDGVVITISERELWKLKQDLVDKYPTNGKYKEAFKGAVEMYIEYLIDMKQ